MNEPGGAQALYCAFALIVGIVAVAYSYVG